MLTQLNFLLKLANPLMPETCQNLFAPSCTRSMGWARRDASKEAWMEAPRASADTSGFNTVKLAVHCLRRPGCSGGIFHL